MTYACLYTHTLHACHVIATWQYSALLQICFIPTYSGPAPCNRTALLRNIAHIHTYMPICIHASKTHTHTHTLDCFLFGRTDTQLYSDSLSRNLRDRNRLSHCLCVQAAADSCKLQLHDSPRCLGIPQQACEICWSRESVGFPGGDWGMACRWGCPVQAADRFCEQGLRPRRWLQHQYLATGCLHQNSSGFPRLAN